MNQALFTGHYVDINDQGDLVVATSLLKPKFDNLIGFTEQLTAKLKQQTDRRVDTWNRPITNLLAFELQPRRGGRPSAWLGVA